MKTIRVDGNDALAVYQATKLAREYIIKQKAPVFMECMTYRIGDHSTSDYSALYREEKEIDSWRTVNDPIKRLGNYLKLKNQFRFTDDQLKGFRKEILTEVAQSLKRQSEALLPNIDLLFDQVYDKMTDNLIEQRDECRRIVAEHGAELKIEKYDK